MSKTHEALAPEAYEHALKTHLEGNKALADWLYDAHLANTQTGDIVGVIYEFSKYSSHSCETADTIKAIAPTLGVSFLYFCGGAYDDNEEYHEENALQWLIDEIKTATGETYEVVHHYS